MKGLSIDDFLKKFDFRKEGAGLIGLEREFFLAAEDSSFVPQAVNFLGMANDPKWGCELSACQVEDRTTPQKELEAIRRELVTNEEFGRGTAKKLGLSLRATEVAPQNMPLDVYPDERYLRIVKKISQERLLAACRVTGTHIHLGMPDIDSAIRAANYLRRYIGCLSLLGDHSNGERLRLYKIVAPDCYPPLYQNAEHFFEIAKEKGFAANPRDCWHLIRISIHGTVELRMFGVTEDIDEIIRWISIVRFILQKEKK